MFVLIEKYPIDASIFRNCCINERLRLVYFIHRPKGLEGEISLSILFESTGDTRRFYDEYHEALFNNHPIYEFKGEAWFSVEVYERLLKGTDTNN